MTHIKLPLPFHMPNLHQFDLSNHQPILLLAATKKLMPTVIRLAKLYEATDKAPPSLVLNSREEIINAITAFLDLIDQEYFPIHLERVEDEVWEDQTYHPLLDQIPVRPMGFACHDIEPEDYGDLVALINWLSLVHDGEYVYDQSPPKSAEQWTGEEIKSLRFMPLLPILSGMELPEPINGLPDLIKMVLHETSTLYLDACPFCAGFSGPDFKWTVENFIWLCDDWEMAKPIYENSQKLIKWTQNNQERLQEVSMILKKAHSIHQFYKDDACQEWF